jgi:DNA-binding NtrC family response regulator
LGNPGKKKRGLSVLVATQDEDFREMLLAIAKENEYPITIADSCKDALQILLGNEFDLLVLDPNLKELTGLEIIHLIKKICPNTPMIVMSDETTFETGVTIAQAGVYFRLGKPINARITKELVESVAKRLEFDT